MENSDEQHQEVDALCKECGHGFKSFVDRLINDGDGGGNRNVECPVCGCTACEIGD